jgi:hypothetical protein
MDKAIALSESIKLIGLLNPITITEDKVLISGRHRLEAHRILGVEKIEARVVNLKDVTQELAEIDENIIRNELNDIDMGEHLIERDKLLERLGIRAKRGDNRFTVSNRPEIISGLRTNKDIGKKIGMSGRLIRMKKQIARGITPRNKDILRPTQFATNTTGLLEISRLDPITQDAVVDRLMNGRYRNIMRLIFRVKREEKRKQTIRKLRSIEYESYVGVDLIHGDFTIVGDRIEDDSIDLIFTDPPYLQDNSLYLYEEVSKLGKRVLKDGGVCLVYAYQSTLPDVISVMSRHLKYWWTISINFKGKHGVNRPKGIFVEWKPLLFYVKGNNRLESDPVSDCLKSNLPEKILHKWEQDTTESDYYIHHLTPIDGVVLDCMMGTGTTGVSCIKTGRGFKGIEIDKERFRIAEARIYKTIKSNQISGDYVVMGL